MKSKLIIAGAALALITSCSNMENPLLTESTAPFGAPQFDKIKTEHYLPAFEAAIAEAKAEIDAIVANEEEPSFENTIEAMEYSGKTLNNVGAIFYNLMEAHTNDEMQAIAEEIAPKMTEFSMYVSLNEELFKRVKAVYEKKDQLGLDVDQMKLLEDNYKSFVRGGANLSDEDKEHIESDIAIAKQYFEYFSINLFCNNHTTVKRDEALAAWFEKEVYPHIKDDERIEVLLNNTDLGVG